MRFLLPLLIIGLTIYAVIDCVRSEHTRRMVGPTWLWVTAIVVIPVFGAVAWLVVSRTAEATPPPRVAQAPRAPDDDPDFLRYLNQQNKRGVSRPAEEHRTDDNPTDGESPGQQDPSKTNGADGPSSDKPEGTE